MATVAQQLADAREAKHKLITGKMARVFMDQNGERVEFTQTNISQLNEYIRLLEGQLSPSMAAYGRSRPIGFTF